LTATNRLVPLPETELATGNLGAVSDLVASAAARYAEENTSPFEDELASAAAWTQGNTPVPRMMSGLAEARLLEVLIVASGARHVLEVGSFTGVGALTCPQNVESPPAAITGGLSVRFST
jgi:predicted O-methyltransferase YrrM